MKENLTDGKCPQNLPMSENRSYLPDMINSGYAINKHSVLFFDMDGTLVNTDFANYLSYKTAVSIVIGKDIEEYNPMKRLNRNRLKSILSSCSESDYEKIIQEKERCYKDYLDKTYIIKENVDILLKYSTTHRTVLVSNCRRNRALTTLSYHGLSDKFTNLFYLETNTVKQKNKYRNAIDLLGVSPEKIVAFENEGPEIAAAIMAGIKIINPKILL